MASPYGWIITADHCGGNYKGHMYVRGSGTRAERNHLRAALRSGQGSHFTLYDGDGNLDYAGRIIVPPGQEGGELWFKPLDWAKADTGSASIRYLNTNTGVWEQL
ncbi:hypothetical protein ACIBKY_51340 [Nonomuraea sp. NPDC050394]|uniref:hypothetical protein n=1 Tax=Nonomuraea sp. NPDC050394 TaxID=3364363 RepID=UPI003791DFE7